MLLLALALTPARQTFFQTPYSLDETKGKQAVVETSEGTFVIQLLPDAAPNHVGYFVKLARDGAYTGTLVSSRHQVRHHPGRRSAVERSVEDGAATARADSISCAVKSTARR